MNRYNGLINIYKEAGYTSNDVVGRLRGILHQKKIGHTGTLDPEAVGVLVVCLGNGTRLVEELTDHTKEYIAVCRLGVETDTQDMTGTILRETVDNIPEVNELMEAVNAFVGDYDQIPPMYSALKVNGKKLYELARQGIEVERKSRKIHIDSISVLDTSNLKDKHEFTMEVRCSKGTYIRTLCHDIGQRLGCGGAMAHLTRTTVGSFHLETAVTLDMVEKFRDEDKLSDIIVPVETFFRDLDSVHVKNSSRKYIENGNPFRFSDIADVELDDAQDKMDKEQMYQDKTRVRVYDEDGVFFGIYKYDARLKCFRVEKYFYERA
ncbi:tRNA pseudouridine(55) synthase TruB [Butyrivibrio sp. NC3005]|uniref:tRNA pseudouridine(55) synthase TruB n=1 Tax=Butyrivibrio sp. NC3005 TaxID=1280685 RepID=UPI000407AFEE|nr:tRNA pseudouridine(55) synthase TruB [Butyrivibrio sp. NC3005]